MARHNTNTSYGSVAKAFHWLTALLILTLIPLGIVAENMAHAIQSASATPDQILISRTTLLFSLHKTLGVAVFFVALARILWAITQPRPGLLNGDNALESFAATTVHCLLYGSLVVVPLTGWVHHAATTGFAPIWWPFGQSLPFVAKDENLAETAGTLHYLLQWVLIGAIVLHVMGAFKHHLIDQDATLRRMLPGLTDAMPTSQQPGHAAPFFAAIAVWVVALVGAAGLGWFTSHQYVPSETQAEALSEAVSDTGNWNVQDGTLGISVVQMGSEIKGSFEDWSAQINFDETADANGEHGNVSVEINVPTLTLGSVTGQALGTGYLASEEFPTATFEAVILTENNTLQAKGNLKIKNISIPLTLPFELAINGDTAEASGQAQVDRRDFKVGMDVTDEGSLGFAVGITFQLTAQRQSD